MFIVTAHNKLINLNTTQELYVNDNVIYAIFVDGTKEVIIRGKDNDVALWHIKNIADAIDIGLPIYVVGTDTEDYDDTSISPSSFM